MGFGIRPRFQVWFSQQGSVGLTPLIREVGSGSQGQLGCSWGGLAHSRQAPRKSSHWPQVMALCIHPTTFSVLSPSLLSSLPSILVFLFSLDSYKFLAVSLLPFSSLVLVTSDTSLPLRVSVCTSAKWGSWEVDDELCLESGVQRALDRWQLFFTRPPLPMCHPK